MFIARQDIRLFSPKETKYADVHHRTWHTLMFTTVNTLYTLLCSPQCVKYVRACSTQCMTYVHIHHSARNTFEGETGECQGTNELYSLVLHTHAHSSAQTHTHTRARKHTHTHTHHTHTHTHTHTYDSFSGESLNWISGKTTQRHESDICANNITAFSTVWSRGQLDRKTAIPASLKTDQWCELFPSGLLWAL